MILVDKDIEQAVAEGKIVINDFDKERLNPASYDILLGNKFVVNDAHSTHLIDPVKRIMPKTKEIIIPDDGEFILHPGVSVLGTSWDYFGSEDFLVQLSGKSSLARIGLLIHNTAGLINPGHFLNITLELCNLNNVPIVLRPKMPIGQLIFSTMSSNADQKYHEVGRFSDNNWDNFADKK